MLVGGPGGFAAGRFCEALPFSHSIPPCAGPVPQAHGGVPAGAEEQPADGAPRCSPPQLRPQGLLQEEAGKMFPTLEGFAAALGGKDGSFFFAGLVGVLLQASPDTFGGGWPC